MTAFRKIVPNSVDNQINERYEHLLTWLSVDQGIRQWFFSHNKGREVEDFDSFSIEGFSDIRNVPSEDRISHKCTARFMDSKTLDYVRSIFASNRIYKITKLGERIPVYVKTGKVTRDNQIKNFEIELEFDLKEKTLLNV